MTPAAPDWAAMLGDAYAEFRAVLVRALADMQIVVDEAHIDCGVLHTPASGTMGLTNVARLCHAAPRERWPMVIADHLRRATAKAVPIDFAQAAPNLRLRITPDRLVEANPAAYVSRELARGLYLTIAIDKPEHVVFVHSRELAEWQRTADELFEIARANTRAEPALERQEIELVDGPTLTVLLGDSYFTASHVLFLESYLDAGAHGLLVGVPDRHALVVLPLVDKASLGGFGPIVRLCHARFAEEPGAITDQLYWRRGHEYVKVACGVRDDGTPWVAPPEAFNELVGRLSAG